MTVRTYDELIKLKTFEERFKYLKLDSSVGGETFGAERYLNQLFYTSGFWARIRDQIIIRDNACDLGIPGLDIRSYVFVHHMNPITIEDIVNKTDFVTNPNYLICTTRKTHTAIHFGNEHMVLFNNIRKPNDTKLW